MANQLKQNQPVLKFEAKNWRYAGGTFPEAKTSMDDFWKKYFKPSDETGTAEVKLLTNISRVKMEVSED